MMRGIMLLFCSLLAVCSVYAQDNRHRVAAQNPKIYRLPPFERAVRCTKFFDYDK